MTTSVLWESIRDPDDRRRTIYRRAIVDGKGVGAVARKAAGVCPDPARPWRAVGYPLKPGIHPSPGNNTDLGWYASREAAEDAVRRYATTRTTPRAATTKAGQR